MSLFVGHFNEANEIDAHEVCYLRALVGLGAARSE